MIRYFANFGFKILFSLRQQVSYILPRHSYYRVDSVLLVVEGILKTSLMAARQSTEELVVAAIDFKNVCLVGLKMFPSWLWMQWACLGPHQGPGGQIRQ